MIHALTVLAVVGFAGGVLGALISLHLRVTDLERKV